MKTGARRDEFHGKGRNGNQNLRIVYFPANKTSLSLRQEEKLTGGGGEREGKN